MKAVVIVIARTVMLVLTGIAASATSYCEAVSGSMTVGADGVASTVQSSYRVR